MREIERERKREKGRKRETDHPSGGSLSQTATVVSPGLGETQKLGASPGSPMGSNTWAIIHCTFPGHQQGAR